MLYRNVLEHDEVPAEALRAGNLLCKRMAEEKGQAYDSAAHEQFVSRMMETCTHDFFRRVDHWGLESERPVFVIGLPRTGTTLVEQILAGHSKIVSAGELTLGMDDFLSLSDALSAPAPIRHDAAFESLARIDCETISRVSQYHYAQLQKLDSSAARIVDKNPDNYLILGLLSALFPRARFIHCRRDARDVALFLFHGEFQKHSVVERCRAYRRQN